jgi:hypothetical protein
MVYAENHNALALVFDNLRALKDRGIYEQALLDAWIGDRVNHSHWPDGVVAYLSQQADPAKLRAAGDPVPGCPIVVYRGISGHGRRRRKLGWSWIDSPDVACWFALRLRLANPAIPTATVEPREILAWVNDRQEREFVVRPQTCMRLRIDVAEMERREAKRAHFRSGPVPPA